MGCKVTYIPLGELAKFESGGTPSKKEESYWNGAIPWISAKTLVGDAVWKSDLCITKQGLDAGSKLAPKGSLLLLTRGSGLFKRIPLAIAEKDVAYNQDIKCIEATAKGISNRYLFYALKVLEPAISAMLETTGIGAGKLATDRLKALQIPVLDETARSKVTYLADCINGKLSLNTKLNGYLDEWASGLFDNWISSCAETTTIGEIAEEILDYTKLDSDFVQLINSSDVTDGVFPDPKPIENKNLKGHFKKRFKTHDVLYSEIRPRNRHFGYVMFDADNWISTTRLMVIRNRPDKISSGLLYYYLKSDAVTDEFTLKTETRSGTFPQGKYKDMAGIKVPYLPVDEQKEIAAQIAAVLEVIHNNQLENDKLAALRDVLLSKLMSGEIDVSKIDLMQLNSHLA